MDNSPPDRMEGGLVGSYRSLAQLRESWEGGGHWGEGLDAVVENQMNYQLDDPRWVVE